MQGETNGGDRNRSRRGSSACGGAVKTLGSKFKSLDEFGEQPAWQIDDDGNDKYHSYMGAALSLLVFIMTAFFLYSKVMVLVKATDVTIMMNVLEGAIPYE